MNALKAHERHLADLAEQERQMERERIEKMTPEEREQYERDRQERLSTFKDKFAVLPVALSYLNVKPYMF